MKEYDGSYRICPHCGYVRGSLPEEPFQLYPGTVLGGDRYMVGTAAGVGGFGITYRAFDTRLQQVCAVKEYYPSANGIVNRVPGNPKVIMYKGQRGEEFLAGKARFLSEARSMALFSAHPNIVHVYDFFEENGTAYIVMEYLDGVSFRDFIRSNPGGVPYETAEEVTLSVLNALKELHAHGIIHRDVSPDNVFITNGGQVKLIDFGAARFSDTEKETTRSIILKPGYTPPEQYRSKSVQGPWTDVYAAGAMFYRAVTGRKPDESVNRVIKDELPAPDAINPDIPKGVSNAIMRAMAISPELRYQTVDEFAAAIRSAGPVRDADGELKHRRRRRFLILGLAGAAILMVSGFSLFRFFLRRAALHLEPAHITFWYPAREDSDPERLVEGFRESYPEVEVVCVPVPEAEYADKLRTAFETGQVPTVFESSELDAAYDGGLQPLDDAYGFLKDRKWYSDYYFLSKYDRLFPDRLRMPTGFAVPVVYTDTAVLPGAPEKVSGQNDLSALLAGGTAALDPAAAELWAGLYEAPAGSGSAGEFFLNEEEIAQNADPDKNDAALKAALTEGHAAFWLSDTDAYETVQDRMAGLYSVTAVSGMEMKGRFTDLWSVSAAGTEADRRAGVRLVYHLLTAEDQQYMDIQERRGLPLHKEMFREYLKINPELSEIRDGISGLRF